MSFYRPANAEIALLEGLELVRPARRVLAVTAHPDDLEALAGGTLRLMALAGSQVHVAVLSDGRQQTNARSNLGQIRRLEERHAATIIGYAQVHEFGFRDLSLSRLPDIAPRLSELWEDIEPDVVFAFDPSYPEPYITHPDHLVTGRSIINLARSGKNASVYFYGTRDTNVVVDITPVLEDKVQSVLAHRSQLKTFPVFYSILVRVYARMRGIPVDVRYAEGFRMLDVKGLTRVSSYGQWTPANEQGL
jgi:LmbE family N-acetylglucosaminyl deacetylase